MKCLPAVRPVTLLNTDYQIDKRGTQSSDLEF
jgi:hypothetical protein